MPPEEAEARRHGVLPCVEGKRKEREAARSLGRQVGTGAGGGGACMMVQGGVQGFFLQLQCTGIFASIA